MYFDFVFMMHVCFFPSVKDFIYVLLATAELHDVTSFCLQGTEFMDNLAQCLRYYVADRLSNDPGWKNVTVCVCYFAAQAFKYSRKCVTVFGILKTEQLID